jgi:ferredoxin--NADP+ reductase
VAIVGSGPAGCYTAQALRKARPDAEITVFDRMPVPYGLVRYGIAPDHQGTKAVSRQFDRIFERDGVRFVGNVTVGRDVELAELREAFDAVVLATGLPADRRLGIPGEDKDGVYGSARFTRHLNGHPDHAGEHPLGSDVVVIGAGNVAVDVVRLIAKCAEDLDGSDLHPRVSATTLRGGVDRITLVSRSPLGAARCDLAMVKELGRLDGVRFTLAPGAEAGEATEIGVALLALTESAPEHPRLTVELAFGWEPVEFHGGQRVCALTMRSAASGAEAVVPATAVVTAIGYEAGPDALGSMADAPGTVTAGWAHVGPRGALPEARLDGRRAAEEVAARLDALADQPERAGLVGLADTVRAIPTVDFAAWRRIDAAEIAAAPARRVRQKLITIDDLLRVAAPEEHTLTEGTSR